MSLEIVSGSRTIMVMTTPPTGWTKDTSFNDYALRVVTGSVVNRTVGEAFSTVFKNYTHSVPGPVTYTVNATTLTAAQMATHLHIGRTAPTPIAPLLANRGPASAPTSPTFSTVVASAGTPVPPSPTINIDSPTAGGGSHTHPSGSVTLNGTISGNINLAVKYIDCIIAVRS